MNINIAPSTDRPYKPASATHVSRDRLWRIGTTAALICLTQIGWVARVNAAPISAAAAIITVTTTADENNSDGDCSLREAIRAANSDGAVDACSAGSGTDTIALQPGATYTLGTIDDTSDGANGLPSVTTALTIQGDGAKISGSGVSLRLLHVATGANLTVQDVTLTGGKIVGGNGGTSDAGGGGGGAGLGGAIYNRGTLTLERVTITANTATGGNGGNGGITTARGGGGGGGVAGNGSTNSTNNGGAGGAPNAGTSGAFANNVGGNAGAGGGGGGGSGSGNITQSGQDGGNGGFGGGGGGGGANAYLTSLADGGNGGFGGGAGGGGKQGALGLGGTAGAAGFGGGTAANATQTGSTAGGGGLGAGGAIFNRGSLTINNSTLSGNSASGGAPGTATVGSAQAGRALGGALFNRNGTVSIVNSTFNANTVSGGIPAGGSVFNLGDGAAASLNLLNSILANTPSGNTDCSTTSINTGTQVVSGSNILIEVNGGCGTPSTSLDPQLASLADNGGKTQTHAITASSPAANTGTNTGCPSTDQRGFARPVGVCDIGAFEIGGANLAIHKSASLAVVATGEALTYTLTITNNGPHPALGAVITDQLPSGVVFGSASSALGTCSQASLLVTCNLGLLNTVAVSGTQLVTIVVTAPATPGTIVNTSSVSDTNDMTATDNESSVSVTASQRPVASAGPDDTVFVGTAVTLDGSASADPDNDVPLSVHWTQTGGTAVTLSPANNTAPSFTAPASPAVLMFTLAVTDSLGLTDLTPDTVVVTVVDRPITGLTPVNDSPTVLGSVTNFSATISQGTNAAYTWNFGDGSPVQSGANSAHTYAAVGAYTATVTATNGAGTVTATTIANVYVAVAGLSAQGSSPTRLTDTTYFTASTTAGSAVSYIWNFGDGDFGAGALTNHVYPATGIFNAIVTATNGFSQQSAPVNMLVTNLAPTSLAGLDQTVFVSSSVQLDGSSSSDPDGHTPVAYQWVQVSGTPVTLFTANSASPTFTAPITPTMLVFELTAIDSAGLADLTPDSVTITVGDVPINTLTAANSSPTILGDATLVAASIIAGSNVVYSWDLGDGTPGDGAAVSHIYPAVGTYTAVVTATNGAGTVTKTTTVQITNATPIANAGTDQTVSVNSVVVLAGVGSTDPDGHLPLTYFWLQTSGPAVSLSSATAASPSFNAPAAPATLGFTLAVTDARGLPALSGDSVTITVIDIGIGSLTAANSSPTRLTNSTALTSTIVNGTGVTYVWNFGDGSATQSGANATHVYPAAGAFTAIVTATNGQGSVSANTVVIITNAEPVANAGPDQNATVNSVVSLNGGASVDPDNHTPLAYHWEQTGGPAVTLSSASAAAPTFSTPASPAVLTFALVVTDAQGLTDATADELVFTVLDIAIAGLSAANSGPTTLGQTTLFTATKTAGSNVVYAWSFGDGATGSGATPSHTYGAAGSYNVVVSATNGSGAAYANTTALVVNVPPVSDAGPDQTVRVFGAVMLNGASSSDPDGHLPLLYAWTQTSGRAVTLSDPTSIAPTFDAPGVPDTLTFALVTTDDRGAVDATADSVNIVVNDFPIGGLTAVNSSPTRLGDTAYLTATVITGTNVSYVWNLGDGSASQNGPTANRSYLLAGLYTATVTATNSVSQVVATTLVEVTNIAPTANAGADQTVAITSAVSLNGTASDDFDGHLPLAYRWEQIGGAPVTLDDATSVAPMFTSPDTPTVLTFTLSVTDARGLADATPDQIVIKVIDIGISGVNAQNSGPTRLSDTTFFTVTLGMGTGVTYSWTFGDGSPAVEGPTVSHEYAEAGSYQAIVTAANPDGSVTASTIAVVVNAAPVANAGADQTADTGAIVTLNGAGSADPDGHVPLTFRWTQIGGTPVTLSNPNATSPSFTAPAAPGQLTFVLVVTDAQDLADATSDIVVISVVNQGITGLTGQSSSPTAFGANTFFTASVSGGHNISYTWYFGDGASAVGATATHLYATSGTYAVVLVAANGSDSKTLQLSVVVAPRVYRSMLPLIGN